MESVYRQTYTVNALQTDCFGRAKASALLYFAQEAAGGHCDLLKLDRKTLEEKNLFWAVVRQRVQITRLPTLGQTITVETWPMPTTRSAFPRATVAYDREGRELFRVIGLWVLMNIQTRAMVLPGKSGVALPGALRGTELAAPGSIVPRELENSLTRQVCFSDLDRNGHMTNARYLDWVCDLLPSRFHSSHPLTDFTICYVNEATEGQSLHLSWQLLDGPVLQVEALRQRESEPEKQDRVFTAQLMF